MGRTAQDDATVLASRDMARVGIDLDNPATVPWRSGGTIQVPRITDPIRRLWPVEVRDVEFLRANTDRKIKITLPGPFTMSRQAKNRVLQGLGRAGDGTTPPRSTLKSTI